MNGLNFTTFHSDKSCGAEIEWRADYELTALATTLTALAPECDLQVKFRADQASAELSCVKNTFESESLEQESPHVMADNENASHAGMLLVSTKLRSSNSSVTIVINCTDENGAFASLSVRRGETEKSRWNDVAIFCAQQEKEIRKALLNSATKWKAWATNKRLAQLLHASPSLTFIVDNNATVLFAGGVGAEHNEMSPDITVGKNKQIRLQNSKETCRLHKVISESLHARERRALRMADELDEREWAIIIRPLSSGCQFVAGSEILSSQMRFEDLAIVSVEASRPVRVNANLLKEYYNLTDSEAELAAAVVGGQSLADYAKQKKISIATVRWHLRNVLRGTSSKSQLDLVSKTIATLSHPAF